MRIEGLVLGIALGAAILAPVSPQAAEDTPAVIGLRTVETAVSPDGLYTRTLHMEVRASNAAAAMEIGQQSLGFSETFEDLEVLEAYTAKAGGPKIEVGPNAVYTQQSQGSAQYPLFDDQRQKVIVFPNVTGGDTIVYTARWRAKQAKIPGQFTYSSFYSRAVAYNEVRETIIAPKNFPLQVENHDVDFEKQETGDTVTYRWHYSAPTPTLDDPPPVSPLDHLPRFFVSSFKDYDAFGQTFAAIMASKETITPRIQTLADELTAGIRDHQRQAQKIYEWVSKNVRYVAVDIGNGGIVPHDADSVLANAYGDCKDHAVLFSALLKAKGIPSETVLINLGNAYTLPGVPTLVPMNHAITWLPEFKTYADTTAGTAPFGVLPFEEYGKPVIHAVSSGAARRQTPVLAQGSTTLNLKTAARLDKDGKVTGNTTMTAIGPFSLSLRSLGLAIQGSGAARFATALLERQGLVGTGSFDVPPPTDIDGAYTLQANFSYGPKPEYLAGVRFSMVRGIWLGTFAGDFLMGPAFDEKLKDTEPTACFSGRIVEEMTLEPPEGRQFTRLPADVRLRTANLEFTARWSASRSAVTVRREFVSKMDLPFCEGAVRRETAKMLGDIRRHYDFDLVSLTVPLPTGAAVATAAQNLMKRGEDSLNNRDLDSAIRFYSAAIVALRTQSDPNTLATAYNGRGLGYLRGNDHAKAIADFTEAIRIVPKYYAAFANRGIAYAAQRRWARAETDFTEAIRINDKESFAYDSRAESSFARGLFRHVLDDCETSIRVAPTASRCYAIRAKARYVRSEFELAIADGTEALRVVPGEPTVLYNRGLAYLASAQYRKAITDFDASSKITPNFVDVLFARGVAKMKLGDDKGGEVDIAAAKTLEPNIAIRMAGLGVSISSFVPGVDDLAACKTSAQNDVIQGVVYCTRTLAAPNLAPGDKSVTYAMLGDAYFRLGEWDEAIANLDNALGLKPDDAGVLAVRGMVYSRKGSQAQALEDLTRAAKLAPGVPFILMSRAEYYVINGDTDLALADYAEVLRQEPNSAGAYFSRAIVYEKTDQFDKAIPDLNAVVRMRPSALSYGARCSVLAAADRLTAAMADCEKALIEAPNDPTALAARGLIYLKLGEDSKAVDDFNRAIDRNPNVSLAYYGRGLLKLKSGDKSGEDDIADASLLDADLVARMRRRGLKP